MPNLLSLPPTSRPAIARPGSPEDQSGTEVLANHDGQEPWGNFHLATVMFHRARQLRAGSRPRVIADGHKALRIAFLEVITGAVPWEVQTGPPNGDSPA